MSGGGACERVRKRVHTAVWVSLCLRQPPRTRIPPSPRLRQAGAAGAGLLEKPGATWVLGGPGGPGDPLHSAGLPGPRSRCVSELLEGISGSCGLAPLSDGLPCASPALSRPRDRAAACRRHPPALQTPEGLPSLPLRLPPCEVRVQGPVLEAQTECTTCQEAQSTEAHAPPPPASVPVLRGRRKLSDSTSGWAPGMRVCGDLSGSSAPLAPQFWRKASNCSTLCCLRRDQLSHPIPSSVITVNHNASLLRALAPCGETAEPFWAFGSVLYSTSALCWLQTAQVVP